MLLSISPIFLINLSYTSSSISFTNLGSSRNILTSSILPLLKITLLSFLHNGIFSSIVITTLPNGLILILMSFTKGFSLTFLIKSYLLKSFILG